MNRLCNIVFLKLQKNLFSTQTYRHKHTDITNTQTSYTHRHGRTDTSTHTHVSINYRVACNCPLGLVNWELKTQARTQREQEEREQETPLVTSITGRGDHSARALARDAETTAVNISHCYSCSKKIPPQRDAIIKINSSFHMRENGNPPHPVPLV